MWMTFRGPAVSGSRLLDRIRVRWSNWKNRRVAKAYRAMADALQRDPSFAESWQAKIAMTILDGADGKLTHAEANAIADSLMAHLWGVRSNDAAVAQQSPQAAGSRCTAESPMPKNASGRWQHPDAKSDPINDSIYYDHYDCPHCGLHFTVEVAE